MTTTLRQTSGKTPERNLLSRGFSHFFFLAWISGCVTATVSPPTPSANTIIPEAITHEYPTVTIDGVSAPHRAGSLFAFLTIPVGSIVIPNPKLLLKDSVIRALITAGAPPAIHDLTVDISDLSITAYDLLVTRRIACSVASTIRLSSDDAVFEGTDVSVTTSLAHYRSLAFSAQISEVARECMRQFGRDVVERVKARDLTMRHP